MPREVNPTGKSAARPRGPKVYRIFVFGLRLFIVVLCSDVTITTKQYETQLLL